MIVIAHAVQQSTLDSAGPGAQLIEELWWVLFAVCGIVAVLSLAALAYAVFRRRRVASAPTRAGDRVPTRWIIISGALIPAVILTGLFLYVLVTLGALAERQPAAVTLVVTGHKWWWDIEYGFADGSAGFRAANEIRIPAGERVEVQLRSADVIHSFWVPQLQGKMDLIPGRENRIWIQADRPGVYRGQCAEYCGLQHTHMAFYVVALAPAEFAAWAEQERRLAAPPRSASAVRGQRVFLRSGCAGCHAIRGTGARATIAPDLTHIASRLTLAAGTVPNTRSHLAGWIADPQRVKPGNLMPAVPLQAADLYALLDYLGSLR